MSGFKIKCELTETRQDLICRLTIPNLAFVVPPHRSNGFISYTNEDELKDLIKKTLISAVDSMEIVSETEGSNV